MWLPDVLVSTLFLIVMITLYFQFSQNLSTEHQTVINDIIFDMDSISDTLLSSGYPQDWNETTVQQPGVTNGDQRLNLTKLQYVANLSYYHRKWLFGTIFEYHIWLEHTDVNKTLLNITAVTGINNSGVGPDGGMGMPDMTRENVSDTLDPDFQLIVERYLIYNGSTIKLIISLWGDRLA